MLAVEDNPEVRALIEAAEFKYADGISVVRSLRKNTRRPVSRVAGADLWEALMQRAGAEGTPVFLVGGKPEVPAQTESVLRQRWQVNIVGSRDGYFTPEQRRIVRTHSRQRAKIVTVAMGSPRQRSLCATAGACIRTRCIWASAALTMFYRARPSGAEVLAGSGAGVVLSSALQPSRIKRQFRLLRYLRWHYSGKL